MQQSSNSGESSLNLKKIYHGDYEYFTDNSKYCEESFQVFRNKEKMTLQFFSELVTRTATGQSYSVKVSYLINKSFQPLHVQISKKMESDFSSETFLLLESTNTIAYEFQSMNFQERAELKAPVKFHVAAPSTAQSMVFLLSKKIDTSGPSYFPIYHGQKDWTYKGPPETKNIAISLLTPSPQKLKVNEFNLKAFHYQIHPNESEESDSKGLINAHVSKLHAIPYLVEDGAGTKVVIKKLKNLLTEES